MGLSIDRFFTTAASEQVTWRTLTVEIPGSSFRQEGVTVPAFWSDRAAQVVANKYFRGKLGTPSREFSAHQVIWRVVNQIVEWGHKGGYFENSSSESIFREELTHLLIHQKMAFNSPVWFNVGVPGERQQCSACFINQVEDTMESILDLVKVEGMIFKLGSGAGVNLSKLRSSKEHLTGGGTASGPVSFMRGYDAFAGVIKSGGKTRRAAKIQILDVSHPDIEDFIDCKLKEEKKAHALIDAGYDGSFNGEAYGSVFFQNSNHSVRVTDEFMQAVVEDKDWITYSVCTKEPVATYKARDLWHKIAVAAHGCGDPGLQFDTTINDWHTCAATDRIYASNPCSEFVFLNDTACNLVSLNLMKFRQSDGVFDIDAFKRAIEIAILSQEILVDFADYPTPKITKNSREFRPLGLGYTNLGALLMAAGLPYDSDEGRAYSAAITALMGGTAYAMSAKIARALGKPFKAFSVNRESMLRVIKKHRDAALALETVTGAASTNAVSVAAIQAYTEALELGQQFGFRNAQTTVLAPAGTISFMMDADTTGVEPDIALIKYKLLAGGGSLKIVNHTVPEALRSLGYSTDERTNILQYLTLHETIEGSCLKDEHLAVFDCAFRAKEGTRTISPHAHLKMMAAVQPFISGAISKTVNLPSDATVEDIESAYMDAWKMGLKCVALYRDGCKRSQPLATGKAAEGKQSPVQTKRSQVKQEELINLKDALKDAIGLLAGPPPASRHSLPDERNSLTHRFVVAGHKGYLHVGQYPNGEPGEIFVKMAKEGSTVSGLMDALGIVMSLALQHGVPLVSMVSKLRGMRFDPMGYTENSNIRRAHSLVDYMATWLQLKFLKDTPEGVKREDCDYTQQKSLPELDNPPCPFCGSVTMRSGTCYVCGVCGTTTGCG